MPTPTVERRFDPDLEQAAKALLILLGRVGQQDEEEAAVDETAAAEVIGVTVTEPPG